MGTLALESEDVSSDVYLSLGLKELDKGMVGIPRVLSLTSSLFERSVQRNEMLLEAKHIKDVVTVFHGLRAPTLSVPKYIDRIFKYSGCSPSCFVVAQIYVDRFLKCTEVKLTSLNVHRLLITSVMLAAKFMDDAYVLVNNCTYVAVIVSILSFFLKVEILVLCLLLEKYQDNQKEACIHDIQMIFLESIHDYVSLLG